MKNWLIKSMACCAFSMIGFSSILFAADGGFLPISNSGSVVTIPMDQRKNDWHYDSVQKFYWLDLIHEINVLAPAYRSSALQIQKLEFNARAGVGGGSVYLMINDSYVDGRSIDTDPDNNTHNDSNGVVSIELSNIKDSADPAPALLKAHLVFRGQLQMTPINVYLGEPQMVQWQGNDQTPMQQELPWLRGKPAAAPNVEVVPDATSLVPAPSSQNLQPATNTNLVDANPNPMTRRPFSQHTPMTPTQSSTVGVAMTNNTSQPRQQVAVVTPPAAPPAQQCLQGLCVGSRVAHLTLGGFVGEVKEVDLRNNKVGIKWSFSKQLVYTTPDQVKPI